MLLTSFVKGAFISKEMKRKKKEQPNKDHVDTYLLLVFTNFHPLRLQPAFLLLLQFPLSPYHCLSNGDLSRDWVEDSVPSIGLHNGFNSSLHTRHWWLSFPQRTSLSVLSLLHLKAFFTLFLIIPNPSSYFCLPASPPSVFMHYLVASVVLFMY